MRSYLGKAYFEEKREDLDGQQFATAKELDPNDPTPWFYDAIRKQTVNRPVEALRDMQKAKELNDNRAVYRSRLLLDQDLAARSASLARIYSDLGFQQLALVEGWKSVNTDPANYSAHRFLADSYSVLPRHEIARVSELLQSQLLQPINITPIQPRLAESNLFVVEGGGPAAISFNEFNPLFQRDRLALQASGILGDNSTRGDEIAVSGQGRGASFSFGQYHYQTDGYRVNNDFDDDIYNVYFQKNLSFKTSIQTEFRFRKIENGDLQLRFLDDFAPNRRQENQTNSIRLGFHHGFSQGSDLIGNFMYQKTDRSVRDQPDPVIVLFDLEGDDSAYSAELQQLFTSGQVKIITGVGYFDIDSKDVINVELLIPLPPPLPPLPVQQTNIIDNDNEHTNLYLYSYINYLKNVTLTVAGSYDKFKEGDSPDKDQFNPKFGVTWNPLPDTTLRGAVFRVLKRTLITNQTLEPTQIAGFNQFFDDVPGSDSWRYGVAADQKFSQSIYGGAEYSVRDLDVPFTDISGGTPVDKEAKWDEDLARFYLYWTANDWLALNGGYSYERIKRQDLAVGARDVKTHRFPLGINFFHPSGLSTLLAATYYDQQGSFEQQLAVGNFIDGKDQFWLVDAAVGYRLPKRAGFVTIGATNLFDESFQYFDTDPNNPAIQPERLFFVRLTLSI